MRIDKISLALLCALSCFHALNARAQQPPTAPQAYKLEGDIEGVHDPSIIKNRDTWYIFSTTTEKSPEGELPIRCSNDLHRWKRCGYVFPAVPDWIRKISPETKNLWAPDPPISTASTTFITPTPHSAKTPPASRWSLTKRSTPQVPTSNGWIRAKS